MRGLVSKQDVLYPHGPLCGLGTSVLGGIPTSCWPGLVGGGGSGCAHVIWTLSGRLGAHVLLPVRGHLRLGGVPGLWE